MTSRPSINATFHEVLTAAVRDISENGYDDVARLDEWLKRLRLAAITDLPSPEEIQNRMQLAMQTVFNRTFSKSAALKYHPGMPRFTLERLKPYARAELDKRIQASAKLIKLNREQAIDKTLQRFSGWATSIPDQGSRVVDKVDVKEHIAKPIQQIKYEARRVSIDQGAKLINAVNTVVATQGAAIAGKWRSHYRAQGYDARPEHVERDGLIYLIRGSWADEQGLVKPGPAGYSDQITQPGEEVFCFPGDTSLDLFQDVEKAYRRWYEGDLVTLTTGCGRKLSATPNHPVFTENGWVTIGELKEGDKVIEIAEESIKSAKLDTDKTLTPISSLFEAIRASGFKEIRRGVKPQFHGDGTEEDVDVVSTAGPLGNHLISPVAQCLDEFVFASTNFLGLAGRMIRQYIFGFLSPSNGVMRLGSGNVSMEVHGLNQRAVRSLGSLEPVQDALTGHTKRRCKLLGILSRLIAPSKLKRINRNLVNSASTGPKIDPSLLVPVPNGHRMSTDGLSDFVKRQSLCTQTMDVVNVDIRQWAGHVYNLQTESGWYVANRIITHNCRCYYTFLYALRDLPPEMLTEKGKKLLEETRIKRPAYA